MPSTNADDEQGGLDTSALAASMVVSTGADRMLAAGQWLSAAADDPAAARDQWARDGVALVRCDSLFAAIRIPGGIVHRAAGTSDPEMLSDILTTLLGGPVFVDPRGGHFYALVEAAAARRWAVEGTACLCGPGVYLGVPATSCTTATRACCKSGSWFPPVIVSGKVYRRAVTITLPDGLPPGRSEPPGSAGIWISNELPEDIEGLWGLLLEQQEVTGLFPLLCWPGSPARSHLAEADAIRLEPVLAAGFIEYRQRRLPFWSNPTPEEVPEGVEPWPHDPGPPFENWPGLAPPVAVHADSPSPAQAAGRTVARLVDTGWHELKDCRLALVPARRSADLPALLEWSSEAPVPLLSALLRSWEDRFGAQVVSACRNSLRVSVARPPQNLQDAEVLACEHLLSTAQSIVDDPPTTFPDYAASLVGRSDWWFWWD